MEKNTIFTIGREFGSGGREIGKKLAEKLSIPFYDKELIALAAQEGDLCEDVINRIDEKPVNSLLYSMSVGSFSLESRFTVTEMPINDKLFLIQSDIIKRIAQEGSCVIIGRCADYILRENKNAFNVFIHAPLEAKKDRIRALYDVPEKKLEDFIKKTDKQRRSYYNYYSGFDWGDIKTYHLTLDSTIGIDKCVEILKFISENR